MVLCHFFDTIEELNDKYALSIEFAGIFMTKGGRKNNSFQTDV